MLSRILGFVKIVLIGAVFGGSGKADVLNAVFNIPNNLRKLMAEGALSSSFIPVLAGSLANKEPHSVTRKIVRNIMAFQVAVLIPLCILSIIFSDFLVNKVLLDFADPQLQQLAVSLFRWFISYILLISISAVLLAVLNVHGYFTIPALTPILFSIAVILSIMCLHRSMGVYSMAVGVLAGGVLQILFQCPLFKKLGYDFKLSFDFKNEKFSRIMVNWFPVLATSCIFAINQQIAMRFASGLETGSSSAISYALVFWQLPFGIFSASITTVLFPQMSKEGATGQLTQLTNTLTTEFPHGYPLGVGAGRNGGAGADALPAALLLSGPPDATHGSARCQPGGACGPFYGAHGCDYAVCGVAGAGPAQELQLYRDLRRSRRAYPATISAAIACSGPGRSSRERSVA